VFHIIRVPCGQTGHSTNCTPTTAMLPDTKIQKYLVVLLHVSALFGQLQGGTRQKNTTTASYVIDVKQYSQNTNVWWWHRDTHRDISLNTKIIFC